MKKKILICDDDPDILLVCKLILQKNDFDVETSTTCEAIFPAMKDIAPDLILMDVWIPEMGGEAATLKLKAGASTKHIPVILFSAHKELESLAKKINADGYIQKPFEMAELIRIIKQSIVTAENNRMNYSSEFNRLLRRLRENLLHKHEWSLR